MQQGIEIGGPSWSQIAMYSIGIFLGIAIIPASMACMCIIGPLSLLGAFIVGMPLLAYSMVNVEHLWDSMDFPNKIEVDFSTPVRFENATFMQSMLETIDDCFALGSQPVIAKEYLWGFYYCQPISTESTTTPTIKQVAKLFFATITILPLLVKCLYRATYNFIELPTKKFNFIPSEKTLIQNIEDTPESRKIRVYLPEGSNPPYIDTYEHMLAASACAKSFYTQPSHRNDPLLNINFSTWPIELVTEQNLRILFDFTVGATIQKSFTTKEIMHLLDFSRLMCCDSLTQALQQSLLDETNVQEILDTELYYNKNSPLIVGCLTYLAHTNRWLFTLPDDALQALVQTLTTLSTKENNSWAQVALGRCYWLGKGIPKDLTKAQTLFAQAEQANNPRGAAWLGIWHYYNKSFSTFQYIQKASQQNDALGHAWLGSFAWTGAHDKYERARTRTGYQWHSWTQLFSNHANWLFSYDNKCETTAIELLKKSAKLHDPTGMSLLAQITIRELRSSRRATIHDFAHATRLLREALYDMDAGAHAIVGHYYSRGVRYYSELFMIPPNQLKAREHRTLSLAYSSSEPDTLNLSADYYFPIFLV